MIKLISLNKREFYLNPELIERIERMPETVITLVNGKKILVKESPEEVAQKVMEYKKQAFSAKVHGVEVQR